MAENKVKFGLNNVYYALLTEVDTYDTPVRFPGAVNLTLEPNGEESPFYADDMIYYNVAANQGYSGEMEVAMVTEQFEKDVLGKELEEESNIIFESRDDSMKTFALLYEIQGDVNKRRYVLYGCTATRSTSEASTVSESVEPQTDTFNFTAAGLTNKTVVSGHTTSTTPESVFNDWFTKVRMPGDEVTP